MKMTSEENVSEVISNFICSKDQDIEDFLKHKALIYEKKSKSRTYLIFDQAALLKDELKLLAYFTIAMQTLKIPITLSSSQIKKLDGLYTRKGNELITEITAFLIGQLAKNDRYVQLIDGNEVMENAMAIVFRAQEIIGGRVVFLECQNNPKIIAFYERNGFKVFRQDPADQLIQMIRLID